MSDIIRQNEEPITSVSRTEFRPKDITDNRNLWLRFVDVLRQTIGVKSLELAQRYAEAKVSAQEVDVEASKIENQVKLLKAKRETEMVLADIRRKDLEAKGEFEKAKAIAQSLRNGIKSEKARRRIEAAADQAIERRNESLEEKIARLEEAMARIMAAGGQVEFELPDTESQEPAEEKPDTPGK